MSMSAASLRARDWPWSRPGVRLWLAGTALVGLVSALVMVQAGSALANSAAPAQKLNHVFVIVEENHGFSDVIGNPAALNLNAMAQQFGIATDYFGVSHPSEPNYVALLGGSTFGIASDDAYWTQKVDQPSLISQLDRAGISWKAYLQAFPHPGYEGICYPAKCNGAPDSDPLYVSKHDAIQNFTTSQNPLDWARQVPMDQLQRDLDSGHVPAFDYVVPDECHDMHGDPPYCIDSGNLDDPQDQHLVTVGDRYLGQLVSEITGAPFWSRGNNAIAVTFDEGDDNGGCCGTPAGGQVATVVVTSHGPRGLRDPDPYSHYSLLRTIQHNFDLSCLANTCDTANTLLMSPMFAVTGSPAIATIPLAEPVYPTPTPTLTEPVSSTTKTPHSAGWAVVRAPTLGTADNSLGAVAGSSDKDIWTVGNFLPDDPSSNPDATLSLAAHFNGTTWSPVATPNAGPNFDTLFGVADAAGKAWAVGVRLDSNYQTRALIESWDGIRWRVDDNPQPGAAGDQLYAVSARSPSDVWAVGNQQGTDGRFETLVEHWNGIHWAVVASPNPGTAGNHLYGVAAAEPDDVWAVGQQLDTQGPDQGLIEHWDGHHWSVVPSPVHTSGLTLLDAVAASASGVWAAGETETPTSGARPLVEQYQSGRWKQVALSPAGTEWTDLWGITASAGRVWPVGTYLDPASDNNETLVLQGDSHGWTVEHAPNPGPGSNILGGVATVAGTTWAVGTYDDGGSRLPLIERHQAPAPGSGGRARPGRPRGWPATWLTSICSS